MSEDLLYKFMPIGPYFRLNFLMLLERSAPFFARKSYFNDPVDCLPFLDLELSDDDLVAAARRAAADAEEHHPTRTALTQLVAALDKLQERGENLDAPHFHSFLGGLTPTSSSLPTLLGGGAGTPIRQLLKDILKQYATAQIAEPQVFSVSSTIDEPTLWGHYADGHKGICVGLSGLRQKRAGIIGGAVDYSTRRPQITVDEVVDLERDTTRARLAIEKIFFNKSLDWKGEDEYRLVARQVGKSFVFPELYFPEGSYISLPGVRVERVIFGSQCTQQSLVVNLICQLCHGETFPQLLQAGLRQTSYGIEFSDASSRYDGRKPLSPIARAMLRSNALPDLPPLPTVPQVTTKNVAKARV